VGAVEWTFPVPHVGEATDLALLPNGTIVVPSTDADGQTAHLQGLSPEGVLAWTADIPIGGSESVPSSPVASATGVIYFGSMQWLAALTADGHALFQTDLPPGTSRATGTTPAVAPDGTAYFQHLTSMSATGGVRWSHPTNVDASSNTVVLRADRILSGINDPAADVVAYDDFGQVVWTSPPQELSGAVAVTGDHTFVRSACPGRLSIDDPSVPCGEIRAFSIDTGTELWRAPSPVRDTSARSVLTLQDGTLLVLGSPSALGASPSGLLPRILGWRLDPNGARVGDVIELPFGFPTSAVLGEDGTLYLANASPQADAQVGIVAVDPLTGLVKWTRSTSGPVITGALTIASNGCLLAMVVSASGDSSAEAICLLTTSRGVAATPWPMTLGHNRAASF
jgi:outer membrane protein assembly factor BamB